MKGMPHFRQYPMGDVVNANLEPGEYVLRRNAVNALGVENMELLNHADGAHGALNKLMVSASLVNHQSHGNASVKTEANGFPVANSPVRQRVDATRSMQEGGVAPYPEGSDWSQMNREWLQSREEGPASEVDFSGNVPYPEGSDWGQMNREWLGGRGEGAQVLMGERSGEMDELLQTAGGYQRGGLIDKFKQSLVDDRGLFRGERGKTKFSERIGEYSQPIEPYFSETEKPVYEFSKKYSGSQPLHFEGEKSQFHGILGRLADRRLRKDIEGIASDFRREYAPQGQITQNEPYTANVGKDYFTGDPTLELGYRKEYEPWEGSGITDDPEKRKQKRRLMGSGRREKLYDAERAIRGFAPWSEDGKYEESIYKQRAEEAYLKRADAPSNIFQLLGGLGKKKGSPANGYQNGGVAGIISEDFMKHLKEREGSESSVYLDSLDNPTAGVGHLLTEEERKQYKVGQEVPDSVIAGWLEKDTSRAQGSAISQAEELGIDDPEMVDALTSVNFQLGAGWKKKFKGSWKAMQSGDFERAADEAIWKDPSDKSKGHSKWYKQTPKRAEDFASALRGHDLRMRQSDVGDEMYANRGFDIGTADIRRAEPLGFEGGGLAEYNKDVECVGGECAVPTAEYEEGYRTMPWQGGDVTVDIGSRMEEDGGAQYLAEDKAGDYFMMQESDIPADSLSAWLGSEGGYQEGGPVERSDVNLQALQAQASLDSLQRMPEQQGMPRVNPRPDSYGGKDVGKDLRAIIPYMKSFGRIPTPIQEKELSLYQRLGVNPDSLPPQLRGLAGKALLQRYGNEQE